MICSINGTVFTSFSNGMNSPILLKFSLFTMHSISLFRIDALCLLISLIFFDACFRYCFLSEFFTKVIVPVIKCVWRDSSMAYFCSSAEPSWEQEVEAFRTTKKKPLLHSQKDTSVSNDYSGWLLKNGVLKLVFTIFNSCLTTFNACSQNLYTLQQNVNIIAMDLLHTQYQSPFFTIIILPKKKMGYSLHFGRLRIRFLLLYPFSPPKPEFLWCD